MTAHVGDGIGRADGLAVLRHRLGRRRRGNCGVLVVEKWLRVNNHLRPVFKTVVFVYRVSLWIIKASFVGLEMGKTRCRHGHVREDGLIRMGPIARGKLRLPKLI
jgi:hypothetical protein